MSDRIGRKPIVVRISLLALLSAYPAMVWLVALTEVMPVNFRVVGFSLAFSLATAVFGAGYSRHIDLSDQCDRQQSVARSLDEFRGTVRADGNLDPLPPRWCG